MVTLKQIAERAGVSVRTVSVVLNGKAAQGRISSQLADRIALIAQELNYRPNAMARAIRMKKTSQIGVLVCELSNPHTGSVVEVTERALVRKGYKMLLGLTNRDAKVGQDYLREFSHGTVDGILNMDPFLGTEDFTLSQVLVPYIHFLRPSPNFSLTLNYHEGMLLALRHLWSLNHRRIGFISGPAEDSSSRERLEAFEAFFQSKPHDGQGFVEFGQWTFDSGLELTPFLLAKGCTAIFGANDLMAAGAVAAVHSASLHVPQDISVVGFDDSLLARMCNPPLTSVHIPSTEVAEKSVEALLALIASEPVAPNREIKPTLVIRTSTSPVQG